MAADQITLRGLRVFGYHGVLDSERRDGQEFIVDAVLWLDTTAAAATDDLDLTANYAALADRLAAIVAGPPVRLIETLAQRLADAAPPPSRWSARWRSPCTSRTRPSAIVSTTSR